MHERENRPRRPRKDGLCRITRVLSEIKEDLEEERCVIREERIAFDELRSRSDLVERRFRVLFDFVVDERFGGFYGGGIENPLDRVGSTVRLLEEPPLRDFTHVFAG